MIDMMKARKIRVILIVCVTGAVLFIIHHLVQSPAPVNFLLISVDTLRPDHLGCYGYRQINTPNTDRLSKEGITFDDAWSSVPLTLPSHATIMTGVYPFSHGVRENGSFVLSPDFVTLAEVLRSEGFSTGAFVIDSRYALDQGFDVYDDDLRGGRQGSAFGHPERTADAVTNSVLDWLVTASEPFFCFVHYFDPHADYDPPAGYREVYGERLYDAEIAFTDDEIGRLLEYLTDRGLLQKTLVVFVSDHGEGLGDHNENTHGLLLYQQTVSVPVILRLPQAHDLHTVELNFPGESSRSVRIPSG
jgi:arylsulfatase A-like enzyme